MLKIQNKITSKKRGIKTLLGLPITSKHLDSKFKAVFGLDDCDSVTDYLNNGEDLLTGKMIGNGRTKRSEVRLVLNNDSWDLKDRIKELNLNLKDLK